MAVQPFLSVWSDLACAGGTRLTDVPFVTCSYSQAKDNSEGCTITVRRNNAAVIAALDSGNVLRIHNELGEVYEYYINNLQDRRTEPLATYTAKPVELMLNKVMVWARNSGRPSTVVAPSPQSASDWISQYVLPSAVLYRQTWWTLGTIDVDTVSSFNFTDQTAMWLIRQILQNEVASLRARRNGEIGYYLDLVDLSVPYQPLALVGKNVITLDREFDDAQQANVIAIAGQQVSGNDEPGRIWYVPWRVASMAGNVVTMQDPSGEGTTILGSDGQPLMSGMEWRLGCITQPVKWSTLKLWRTVYIPSTKVAWGAFNSGLRSMNVETRALGTLLTTNLTKPVDLYFDSVADTMYVADIGGARVTPYTGISTSPTAGTPITVGTGPRRLIFITDGGLNLLLVTHGNANGVTGSNLVKLINTSTNTVSATSGAMTAPAHHAVVSKTQVYLGSDSADAVYRYNANTNSVAGTIVNGVASNTVLATNNGFASLVYNAAAQELWAFGRRMGPTPVMTTLLIIDTTTDTILRRINTSSHGNVVDCRIVNGQVLGVTDDGLLVCYDLTNHTLQWKRRHAAWPNMLLSGSIPTNNESSNVLQGLDYWSSLDVFAIGNYVGALTWMDAQTGGAMIARDLTAASASTPSVTLANSPFPLAQYDEVVLCRDDGYPLVEIPNQASVETYGPIARAVPSGQWNGGSNRVLNGDMVFFDSSRKAVRNLNLVLPDATCEAKWDGYTDNDVNSFAVQANGTQSVTAALASYTFKSVSAGRVFLPGDMLIGAVDFMVFAKATADGSGNVILYAAATGSGTMTNGDAFTVYRPFPSTLLADSATWVALPQMSAGSLSAMFADINVPFIPGETRNLYWGMEAVAFSLNIRPVDWRLRILGLDRQMALLDTLPNPDTAVSLTTLSDMSYGNNLTLPPDCAGGHVQFNVQAAPLSVAHLGCLFIKRLWVQVGNADRGPPDLSAYGMWQLAQDSGVDRGEPTVNYHVEVVEDNPDKPFTLGATVLLRDPAQGVVATPQIVSVTRFLSAAGDKLIRPEIVLDNRDPSFVERVVKAGGY